MQNKNIAFCIRANYRSAPGGDTVQMNVWTKILRQLGNVVSIFPGMVTPENLRNMDAIFIWHLERLHESFQPWSVARHLHKPIFLVPTYWRPGDGMVSVQHRLREQVALWLRLLCQCDAAAAAMRFRSWSSCRKHLLTQSTRLLVNSESERNLLIAEGASPEDIIVIPNVINTEEIDAIPVEPWGRRQGILCIGHFCPRKNQYELIRSARNSNLPITFLGTARPMHKVYYTLCRKAAGTMHHFPGSLSHTGILQELAKARLCVSVSHAETPGISNLEAAALGCNLLLPPIEPVQEYFKAGAYYSTPKKKDFQDLLLKLISQPPQPGLRRHIRKHYCEAILIKKFKALTLPEAFS